MSHQYRSSHLPAPCIISSGIVVNKSDIKRLLQDLAWVRYSHFLDGEQQSTGEGWIVEVFDDVKQATLVVNQSLYLNLHSFDYLHLKEAEDGKTYFELVQDNRVLRLDMAEHPAGSTQVASKTMPEGTLEEMVTQVLSARWDVQMDDENFNF